MGHKRDGSAAAYRSHKAKRKAAGAVYSFEAPSGFTFELYREIDITPFIVSGELPMELVGEAAKALGHADKIEEFESKLTTQDQIKMFAFMRNVVEAKTHKPHITIDPKGEDDIHADEVEWSDFYAIFLEGTRGGERGKSLRKFRRGSESDVDPGPGGEELRDETEQAVGATAGRGDEP